MRSRTLALAAFVVVATISTGAGTVGSAASTPTGPGTTCKTIAQIHHGTKIKVRREVRTVNGVRRTVVVRHRVLYAKTVQRSVCMTTDLDPTFTQVTNDPLDVTFFASVHASGFVGAVLPQGVLSLYVNGSLACSQDVEGTTDSLTCKVELTSTGNQTLITQYLSGTNSATQTEVVNVPAYSTTTQISAQTTTSSLTISASVKDQNGNSLSDTTTGANGLITGSITMSVSSPGMNVAPSSFPIPIDDSCTLTPNLVSGEWSLQGSISTSSAAGCEDTQYTDYTPGQAVTITVNFAKTGYGPSSTSYTWTPTT